MTGGDVRTLLKCWVQYLDDSLVSAWSGHRGFLYLAYHS